MFLSLLLIPNHLPKSSILIFMSLKYIKDRIHPRVLGYVNAVRGFIELDIASKNTIIYLGVCDEANLGDQILLSQAKFSFPEYHLISSSTHNKIYKLLIDNAIKRTSGVLVGGGTLFLGSESMLEILEKLILNKIPIATYGSGVQDPKFWNLQQDTLDRWAKVINSIKLLGVRGPKSLEILNDLGIVHGRMVGDPAVSFALQKKNYDRKHKVVGINMGVTGKFDGSSFDDFFQQMLKVCKVLKKDDWQFKFFCVWPRDLPIIKALATELEISSPDIVEEYFSALRFMKEAGKCSLVVSMKLHPLILSIASGVPSIGIQYQPKLLDFMSSIDSEKMLLVADSNLATNCLELINRANSEELSTTITQWEGCVNLAHHFSEYQRELNREISSWRN